MINTEKIKMVVLDMDGTLTDGGIYLQEDGKQFRKFNAKDGLGIRMLRKQGIQVGIISHSTCEKLVQTRAEILGVPYVYAGLEEKLDILQGWCDKTNLSLDEVAFVGDDLNDLPVMEVVGLSACPADASEEVRERADIILTRNGGEGAVREFADKYIGVAYTTIV